MSMKPVNLLLAIVLLCGFASSTMGQCSNEEVVLLQSTRSGQGWKNCSWTLLDQHGSTVGAGTLAAGYYGKDVLCLHPDSCYAIQVYGAQDPADIEWRLLHNGDVITSGIGNQRVGFSLSDGKCNPFLIDNPKVEPLSVEILGETEVVQDFVPFMEPKLSLFAIAQGGVAPYSYIWQGYPGENTLALVTPTVIGNSYQVLVTDAIGNSATALVKVNGHNIMSIKGGDTLVNMRMLPIGNYVANFSYCNSCGQCDAGERITEQAPLWPFQIEAVNATSGGPNTVIAGPSSDPTGVRKGTELIIPVDVTDADNNGLVDNPVAAGSGGTITLNFPAPVFVEKIVFGKVLPVGAGKITVQAFGPLGAVVGQPITVPANSGVQLLSLPCNFAKVGSLVITAAGVCHVQSVGLMLDDQIVSMSPADAIGALAGRYAMPHIIIIKQTIGDPFRVEPIEPPFICERAGGAAGTAVHVPSGKVGVIIAECPHPSGSGAVAKYPAKFYVKTIPPTLLNASIEDQAGWVLGSGSPSDIQDLRNLEIVSVEGLLIIDEGFCGAHAQIKTQELSVLGGTVTTLAARPNCLDLFACDASLDGKTELNGSFYFGTTTTGVSWELEGHNVLTTLVAPVKPMVGGKKIESGQASELSLQHVDLYPNPAHNRLEMRIASLQDSPIVVSLLDHMGKVLRPVFTGHLIADAPLTISIETSDLAAGLYHVCVTGENGARESYRFVKQ